MLSSVIPTFQDIKDEKTLTEKKEDKKPAAKQEKLRMSDFMKAMKSIKNGG